MKEILICTSVRQQPSSWLFYTNSEALKNYLKLSHGYTEVDGHSWYAQGNNYSYILHSGFKNDKDEIGESGVIHSRYIEDFIGIGKLLDIELVVSHLDIDNQKVWFKLVREKLSSRQKESPPF